MRSTKGPALANRLQAIPPFHVMEVVRIAEELESQGVDVIDLEFGDPHFSSSPSVIEHAALYGQGRLDIQMLEVSSL